MTINCLHGFFVFREAAAGQVSAFMSLFEGLELVPWRDAYTFAFLATAPDFALVNGTYLGAPVTKTFEGEPWEIMRENGLIYDFNLGKVVKITTVTQRVEISTAGNVFLSPGLILPGSLTDEGSRVTDYAARFIFETNRFKYSEITRV